MKAASSDAIEKDQAPPRKRAASCAGSVSARSQAKLRHT
jgi:hypothetical protein